MAQQAEDPRTSASSLSAISTAVSSASCSMQDGPGRKDTCAFRTHRDHHGPTSPWRALPASLGCWPPRCPLKHPDGESAGLRLLPLCRNRNPEIGACIVTSTISGDPYYSYSIMYRNPMIGAFISTSTILGDPYYRYRIIYPKTLFLLLRPLH